VPKVKEDEITEKEEELSSPKKIVRVQEHP
jgi:hypothetical protein